MRQFQIEIVNVTPPVFIKTVKGGYNVLEVAFKQDGRVGGKKFMDFAAPGVYNLLETAKAGDIFDVVSEKNAKGYIDWVSVNPGREVAPTAAETGQEAGKAVTEDSGAPAPAAARTGYSAKGRVVGSTYETAEERATRQAAIIRQATLNAAIEYAPKATEEELVKVARRFETYVYTDLQARAESLRAIVDSLKKTS